jgi:glycosyltransferase involved in cell wall biosynthesis
MCNESNSKRICFVTTLLTTLKAFVLPQTEYLLSRGWDVTWVCAEGADSSKDIPEGVRYVPLPFKRGIDPLGLLRVIPKLYRLFRRERFDLVQYSTPNAAFYAGITAWLARVPIRLYAQWGIRYVGFSGLARTFFKQIERWCCNCSTVVEPDSISNLEFSIKEGLYPREKGRVIWNGSASGVNLAKFDIAQKAQWRAAYRSRAGFDSQHLVIGFVGSIRRDKGCCELIAACRRFFDDLQAARLLLVGDKEHYHTIDKELRDWVESSGRVVYIPPNNEIPQYMACMDVFALPSYREGFGSVVIEAEAMGCPVVVSDVPGPMDAMKADRTGLVVPVRNVEALAAALRDLLLDSAKRQDFGIAAGAFVREHFEQKEFFCRVLEDKMDLVASPLSCSQRAFNQ